MPRVPLPQEQLNPGATPQFTGGRVVPFRDSTGGQIQQAGRALQAAGEAAANIANAFQDDLDNARTKEAFNLWSDTVRQTLHDPNGGYLNAVGKDATGNARKQAGAIIEQKAQDILGQLDNPTQKGMFEEVMRRRMLAVNTQMDGHQARQTHVFHMGESKAMAESTAGGAVESILAEGRAGAEEEIRTAIEQAKIVADGLGFGPNQKDAMVLETTTQIHAGVINRMISEGRNGEASAYLQSVDPKEIAPEERARMQGTVKRATLGDQAHEKAVSVLERAESAAQKQDPGARLDSARLRVEAQNLLREQNMPDDLRQATLDRIDQAVKQRAQAEAADDNELMIEAQTMLVRDPTMGPTQLPPEMVEDLIRGGMWDTINSFARSGRKSENPQARGAILDAPDEFFLSFDSKSELQRELLLDGADASTINTALARFDESRAPAGSPKDPLLTRQKRLRDTAIRSGLVPKPGEKTTTTDARAQELRYLDIQEEANRRLKEAEASAGKQLFGDDLQAVYDSVITDMVYSEGDLAVRRRLNAEELAEAEVEVDGTRVPVLVEETIRAELQRLGLPSSPRDVLDAWKKAGRPDTPLGARGAGDTNVGLGVSTAIRAAGGFLGASTQ